MSIASCRRAIAIALLGAVVAPTACKKSPQPTPPASPQQPTAAPPPAASAQQTSAGGPPAWLDHPQASPGTTVLTAIDPHTLSPSEVQFGISPRHSPDVEYQPGVIVMEHGDQAIRAAGGDGMSWTFDANAPNVSDFAEGKIVFATGRAVGRVLSLKRNGSTVTAILGPVQLTDVIRNGRFIMDTPVDPDKMIAYVAPDYPGLQDTSLTKTASLDDAPSGGEETVVVSRIDHGRWLPASMSRTGADGKRVTYRRRGRRWVDARASEENQWTGALDAGGLRTLGIVAQAAAAPQAPNPLGAPQKVMGAIPWLNADDDHLRLKPVADNSGVGLQYYYNKNGVSASASGIVTLHAPRVECVYKFKNGSVDSAGISIKGSAGVRLSVGAYSASTKFVNMHVQHWVPIDFAIPLGGPVPLSLTFATMFNVNSGLSAQSTVLSAEGEYNFGGAIWAGRAGGAWTIATPSQPTTVKDLTASLSNVSVGISSLAMAFSIRALVGIGAFGFNVGVYVAVRFGGSLLGSPTEAFTCRQATLDAFLDSGLGWQVPGWVTSAINFFLKPLTGHALDAVGDLTAAKPTSIFHYTGQAPGGCASAKKT
ncbi:MAG TPA: hypothetical protein VN607_02350 [Gemmatimonadaceae bacterium]|nr:hypothetical protein [Gemmatimonadaceae bacterium]